MKQTDLFENTKEYLAKESTLNPNKIFPHIPSDNNIETCLDYLYNIRSEIASNIADLKEIISRMQSNLMKDKEETLSLHNNIEENQFEDTEKELIKNQLLIRPEEEVSTTLNMTRVERPSSLVDYRHYVTLKNELSKTSRSLPSGYSCGKKRGKRGKYVMYSEGFKAECIEEVKRNGNEKEVAKFYNIPLKKLKRWIEIGPKRLEGGGRKVMDPQMEIDLIDWINEEKETGNKITSKQVQDKAKTLSRVDKFLASKGWLEKFLKKYDIKIEK